MTRPPSYDPDRARGYERDRGYDRDDDQRDDGRLGGYASQAGDAFETALHEHPLLVGLGAALLGAVAGTLIPNSRYEHRAMGERRNRLVDAGLRHGRRVAQEALAGAERAIDAAVDEFMAEIGSDGDASEGADEERNAGSEHGGGEGDGGDSSGGGSDEEDGRSS